uniref:Heme haloperoxidase family profile domain-containing protein n=1 Tax=Mycena chlorophos TaxID=658473 RepID=A0ABQ0LPF2_MYCCL|nr:predicted protein [Mycena chlorophos]
MKSFSSLALLSFVSVAVACVARALASTLSPTTAISREGLNVDWAPLLVAAKNGLLTRVDKGSETMMSLEPLAIHNLLEHDASFSRDDYRNGTGDNLHFNETIFTALANSNPGVDYYNTTSAARVMYERLQFSIATNPTLINTQRELTGRAGTGALWLAVMGNATTGVAPKNFVQIFFREERLPYLEGWKPSPSLIGIAQLGPIEQALIAGSNWTQSQHCEPVVTGPGSQVNTAA